MDCQPLLRNPAAMSDLIHPSHVKVTWTLVIEGGQAFVMQVEGNPGIEYDGQFNLYHLYLTRREIAAVVSEVESLGSKVQVYGPESVPVEDFLVK